MAKFRAICEIERVIIEAIEESQMRQVELARKSNVSQGLLSLFLETDLPKRRTITLPIANRLCEALGLELVRTRRFKMIKGETAKKFHLREGCNRAMNESKKLSWKKAYDCDDCFDLQVKNPEDVDSDSDYLLRLLTIVDNASAGKDFNKKAFSQFKAWIKNPNEVLPEFAFATLDSWSFSEGNNAKGTDKQMAARQLWDALFCSRPDEERRLTDPKISAGKKIIKERFDLWWPNGHDC